MNFELLDIYKTAFGKDAEPFDEKTNKSFADFIFTSVLATAYDLTENKHNSKSKQFFQLDKLSCIHLLLYYMDKAGITLEDFYSMLSNSQYFESLQSIDKYLYRNYCTDELFAEIDDDDIFNRFFEPDDFFDELEYIPSHFLIKTWSLNDILTCCLNQLDHNIKKPDNLALIQFIEKVYLHPCNAEIDYDDWAQDEIMKRGIDPMELQDTIENMLDNYLSMLSSSVKIMIDDKIDNRSKHSRRPAKNNLVVETTMRAAKEKQQLDKNARLQNIVNLPSLVVGQEDATNTIVDKLLGSFVGFHTDSEPLASFLLTGPTGVGKTETAKAVADLCCDGHIYVVDMTSFKSKTDVSRLTGASPNYVGYDDKNTFCEFITEHPDGVILFDELEKGHPECLDIIMRILDEAEFINAKGEKFSLKDNIIFCTTNYTSNNIRLGFNSDNASTEEKMIGDTGIRKEIVGRFHNVIEYKMLTKDACKKIAMTFIENKLKTFKANNKSNINLEYTDSLLEKIVVDANTDLLGARDLKKSIQKNFIAPISQYIMKNQPSDCTLLITGDGVELKEKLTASTANANNDIN